MSLLRSSFLSMAATTALLLATSPSNAVPSNIAPANSLGLTSHDVIQVQMQPGGPAVGRPSTGGPAIGGPSPGGPRVGGPGPSGGPRFSGPGPSGGPRVGRQFGGPRASGRQFTRPQFQGDRFAFRRGRFHGRFNDGPAYWPYAAATPYLYDYGYNYCERVLEPRLTRRGIVMHWVRRCPGEDYFPYW